MNFKEFKQRVELLASSPANNLLEMEMLIIEYYEPLGFFEHVSDNSYVVRASKNDSNELFKNISRCSYNPNHSSIPLQRCNFPGQQVFYCSMFTKTDNSSTSMTCIIETALEQVKDLKINKAYYTLSRWDLRRRLKLAVLPFSKLSHKQNADFKAMSKSVNPTLNGHIDRKEILTAYSYMSDVFCRRRMKNVYYKISSAFYNFISKSPLQFDGLAYSSANTERSGITVALRKEIVDHGILIFCCAMLYRLKRETFDKKSLTVFPCSEFSFPNLHGHLHFILDDEALKDFRISKNTTI